MANAPHLASFLDAARYFIGVEEVDGSNTFASESKGDEIFQLYGGARGTPWCAIFVSACAAKAEILNIVIAKSTWARGILEDTRDKYNGTWIDGPYLNGGNPVIPVAGDLILFYTGPRADDRHVGIVESADAATGTITTIEGNSGNACRRKEYPANFSTIYAFVHPDWSRVGDNVSDYLTKAGQIVAGPLYQNQNDRHDMTLRQVGYIDPHYKFVNSSSDIALSVINYTSMLGDLYNTFAPAVASLSSAKVDTSQLTGNIKIAMDYLLKWGYSGTAAAAITGCLQVYSSLNSANQTKINVNTFLYGIGAWASIRFNEMKNRVGAQWLTNLTGQLEYLLYDLSTNYGALVLAIKLQPLDLANVGKCALAMMSIYNEYYNSSEYLDKAVANAEGIYGKLVITQSQIIGNTTGDLKDQNGQTLTAQFSVDIPATVSQTGIIDDYTSYSYWYSRWNNSSPQRKLAEMWADQGYPNDKGIALIGGYYCVAVRPKFGSCGDVIVVTLEDGLSFNAIICDEKGADAGSEWGHVKSNGISLIEWQRVKTVDGHVVISGITNTDVDPKGYQEWYGKKVTNITNYGKYADVKWT